MLTPSSLRRRLFARVRMLQGVTVPYVVVLGGASAVLLAFKAHTRIVLFVFRRWVM